MTSAWAILRNTALFRDNWTCQQCGARNTRLEVDHILARADGGMDDLENLQTLCVLCHIDKSTREQFRRHDCRARPELPECVRQWDDYIRKGP